MPPVTLKCSLPDRSPVSEEQVAQIIEEELPKLSQINEFSENIAHKLRAKTSQYKFMVSVVKIELDDEVDADVTIESKIAVAWDDNKDGFWSTRVDTTHKHMITILWVFAG